jgi:hypothetical protein
VPHEIKKHIAQVVPPAGRRIRLSDPLNVTSPWLVYKERGSGDEGNGEIGGETESRSPLP